MGLAEIRPKFGLRGQSAHFTIEVCAMPGEASDYLYAAINQTQFVFAKVMKGVTAALKTLREKTFLPSSTGAPHMRCVKASLPECSRQRWPPRTTTNGPSDQKFPLGGTSQE
jgi:hypothetical protein